MFKWSLLSLYFFIVALVVLFKTNLSLFYVLPLIVSICTLILSKQLTRIKNSFIIYIFYAQFFIKYSLIPLLYDERIIIYHYKEVYFVMILELISIFLTIYFFTKRDSEFNNNKRYKYLIIPKFDLKAKLILCLLFAYLVVNYVGVKTMITFLGSTSNFAIETSSNDDMISEGGYIGLVFTSLRFLVTLLLFSVIYRSKIKKDKNKVIIMLFMSLILSLFIIGTSRFSILQYLMASVCLILYLFPNKKRMISILSVFMLVLVVSISTIYKSIIIQSKNTATIDFNIASYGMLNAYFSGPSNVDTGIGTLISMKNISTFNLIVNDVFKNIPGLTTLSNSDITTTKFFNNTNYKTVFSSEDQIPPLVAFSAAHYSIYLSAFYSILFVWFALYFEKKSLKSKEIILKYIFILFAIKFSFVTMQNFSSIIGSIFSTLIIFTPILLLKNKLNVNRYI